MIIYSNNLGELGQILYYSIRYIIDKRVRVSLSWTLNKSSPEAYIFVVSWRKSRDARSLYAVSKLKKYCGLKRIKSLSTQRTARAQAQQKLYIYNLIIK